MRKFREKYIGKDCYLLDISYPEDFMPDCVKFCRLSYLGSNIENIINQQDANDPEVSHVVLQSVLDSRLIRSLLLEEYTEGKKE